MKNKKIKLNKFGIKLILTAVLVLFVSLGIFGIKYLKDTKIDRVLKTENYSYLPVEAKNYIRKVYENTGEVLLTEENKKPNKPYLNPMYVSYLGLSDEEKALSGTVPNATILDFSASKDKVDEATIPSRFDLRDVEDVNYITPLRNQGKLGLCWTFASASVAETHLMWKNKIGYSSSTQLISERQIDYATAVNGINNYKSEYVSFVDRELGSGGNFYISTVALANGISLVDYNWKKYSDTDLEKMELYQVLNYNNSLFEVKGTINMPELNFKELSNSVEDQELKTYFLNLLKSKIMENGAAYVSTYYSDACIHNESSLDNIVLDVERNCASSYDGHAMTVIGWDDDIEYDYCADTRYHEDDITGCNNVVRGKGVWILKNSWGATESYPYLAYDSSFSGFNFITNMSSKQYKSWDNNYIVGSNDVVTDATHSLKDSKIVGTERLKDIKFITYSQNGTYSVKIKQADGTYTKEYSTNVSLPGLVTFNFGADNIIVNENSEIIVNGKGFDFIDNISVFTSNLSIDYYIDLDNYDNLTISETELRFYSETKNIPSGATLTYQLFDQNNKDVSDAVIVTNNIVAENNVNTLISSFNKLESGTYTLSVSYNNEVIDSITIHNLQMSGSGTEEDPYVIKNSSHLDQIRNEPSAHYVLANDIDLTQDTREGGKFYNAPEIYNGALEGHGLGGHGWFPINNFSGTLDGQGHTIKGLYHKSYLYSVDGDYWYYSRMNNGISGLFGTATGNASVKNIVLEDFDVSCEEYCGTLLGTYTTAYNDKNEYNLLYENIVVKNSRVSGIKPSGSSSSAEIGSVFGEIYGNTLKSNVTISNVYADTILDGVYYSAGGLSSDIIPFDSVNINNVQLIGSINGDFSYGAVISNYLTGNTQNIQNVMSTLFHDRIMLFNLNSAPLFPIVTGVNMLKLPAFDINKWLDNDDVTLSNVNLFELNDALSNLKNMSNYSTWVDFDKYWEHKSVDGILRYPVLKNANFQYTSIPDIYINQELNVYKNIHDYVTPQTDAAKRITFKSNDENIVTILEDGTIVPQSSGETTVHVESVYYDGYVKDVPISVEYEPHYIVKFDSNGGEGDMSSVEVSTSNAYSIKANEFTMKYHEFNGWNTKADGSGEYYDDLGELPARVDKTEVVLYAQWIGEEFEVTFDAAGGTSPITTRKYRYGDLYGELPIPYKEGYGFKNWCLKGDGWILNLTSDKDVNTAFHNQNLPIVAQWVADSYTVAFYPNGGDGFSKSMYINNNVDGTLLENTYIRENYVFKGWNTKADGTGESYSDQQVINLSNVENSLLTLYAQWEPYGYSVEFNPNGGEGTIYNQDFAFDIEQKLLNNQFTKTGYSFKEWTTMPDGNGDTYTNEQVVKNLAGKDETIVLYAQWSPNKYNVIFNANGGEGSMSNQELTYDVELTLNENKFTKEGYVFSSWNTNADGSGTGYKDKQSVKNLSDLDDIALYAQWVEKPLYTIEDYEEDLDNNYIDKVDILTDVETYKSKFKLGSQYTLEIDLGTKEHIFTGSKTKIFKAGVLVKEFTNIVRGEVNGDGKVGYADYVNVYNHIYKTKNPDSDKKLLVNEYLIAADMSDDNKVGYADYVKIYNKIQELKGGIN